MITLNKLVQNPHVRKNVKNGFEVIDKVRVKDKTYLFGIPFRIITGQDGKIKITFNVEVLDGILPHFQTLKNNGKAYALTTAYENVLEIKRIVRKDIKKIETILAIKLVGFKKAGYLQEDKDLFNEGVQLTLDIEVPLSDNSKPIGFDEIKDIKDKVGISSFKEMSISDMKDIITKNKIKINTQLEQKRGYLSSVLLEIATLMDHNKDKLSSEQLKELQTKLDEAFTL